jgi:hypothetical protein
MKKSFSMLLVLAAFAPVVASAYRDTTVINNNTTVINNNNRHHHGGGGLNTAEEALLAAAAAALLLDASVGSTATSQNYEASLRLDEALASGDPNRINAAIANQNAVNQSMQMWLSNRGTMTLSSHQVVIINGVRRDPYYSTWQDDMVAREIVRCRYTSDPYGYYHTTECRRLRTAMHW